MLKPRKRITKRKLKEDKLVTFYFKALDKLEQNAKLIFGVVGAVLIIIAGLVVYGYYDKKAEEQASVELVKAMRAYEIGDYQNAIAQLSVVTGNYGGSRSGKLARFYLANAFYQTNDFANAENNYRRFLSDFSGNDHFLAAAQGGVAASLVQQGRLAEAAKAYEKAAKKYDSVLAAGFLLQAGRCYSRANNPVKAKEMYELLIEKYPKAPEKDEAIVLLNMLKI